MGDLCVAPHTGAWIETLFDDPVTPSSPVAPHTGAWIETLYWLMVVTAKQSHPTRVRGLKQALTSYRQRHIRSHPTRVRGLKRPPRLHGASHKGRTPHGCVD